MSESAEVTENECEQDIGIKTQSVQLVEYHTSPTDINAQTGKSLTRSHNIIFLTCININESPCINLTIQILTELDAIETGGDVILGYTESASNNTENYGKTIEHSLLVQFNIDVFDSHGFRVRIINVWEIYCTFLFFL